MSRGTIDRLVAVIPVIIVGVLISGVALCQSQPTKTLRVFKPPDPRVLNALVAKDEGCAKDLAKVPSMEGLAQRKLLADLLAYGCVQYVEGKHPVHMLRFQEFGEGAKKVRFTYVEIFGVGKGWVPSDEVYDASVASGPKAWLIAPDAVSKVVSSEGSQKKQ